MLDADKYIVELQVIQVTADPLQVKQFGSHGGAITVEFSQNPGIGTHVVPEICLF